MNALRIMTAVVLALLCPAGAMAQQTEQISINSWLYGIPCNYDVVPGGVATGNQLMFLENYVDGILPNPAYITQVLFWAEAGANGVDATTTGNVGLALDPQQRYVNAANFPAAQLVLNHYTKPLNILELYLGGKRTQVFTFNPPIAYRPGDVIIVGPECKGGGTLNLMAVFNIQATADFDPANVPTTLLNVPLTNYDVGGPPLSARILVPGPDSAVSKIRAHLFWPLASNSLSTVSRISVCLQSATTPSSCSAAPVEMLCNRASGLTLFNSQDLWCDWTDLAIPAGQNALITVSRFGATNRSWAYATSGGTWQWGSTGDSWNTVDMQGTIFSHPGWSAAVDKVQVR